MAIHVFIAQVQTGWIATCSIVLRHVSQIEDPASKKKRIYQLGLLNYLKDNQQAWLLQGNGVWERAKPAAGETP